MSGEGDSDPIVGHSQLSVETLPLTNKDPPENPEDKGPPQDPPAEGLTSGSPENNTRDKKLENISPTEKSKQLVDSPSEYPPQDQPETPIDPGEDLEEPSYERSQKSQKETYSLDFGQEKQRMHQTRIKGDIDG